MNSQTNFSNENFPLIILQRNDKIIINLRLFIIIFDKLDCNLINILNYFLFKNTEIYENEMMFVFQLNKILCENKHQDIKFNLYRNEEIFQMNNFISYNIIYPFSKIKLENVILSSLRTNLKNSDEYSDIIIKLLTDDKYVCETYNYIIVSKNNIVIDGRFTFLKKILFDDPNTNLQIFRTNFNIEKNNIKIDFESVKKLVESFKYKLFSINKVNEEKLDYNDILSLVYYKNKFYELI